MIRAFLMAMAALVVTELPATVPQASAEDAPAAAPIVAQPLSDARINELCGKLGAADFSSRELATKELLAGGSAVIDKVAAAAETDSLEVVIRCLTILKELYQRPEEQTRGAVV